MIRELIRRGGNFSATRTGGRFFINVLGRQLLDSAAIMRDSLRNIGETFDLKNKKLEVPDDFYINIRYYWPTIGRDYLRADCESLFEAILRLREGFAKLGGALKATVAATAMDLFRRKYLDREYITEPWYSSTESAARWSYAGGRVEVFNRIMKGGFHADINSCFPYAMLSPVPMELIRTYKSSAIIPEYGIIKAVVDIPREEWIPPLFYKAPQGKLLFPTGSWNAWLTSLEAKALVERYGSNAVKVEEVHEYDAQPIFKGYVTDLYARRMKARADGDNVTAETCKLGLNSLYGKLATTREREKIVVGPEYAGFPYDNPKELARIEHMREMRLDANVTVYSEEDHIYGIPQFVEFAPYIFPAAASWITANARVTQLQPLLDMSGESLNYCDTDGFYSQADSSVYKQHFGKELGKLKLVDHIKQGEFTAPKTYFYETMEGKEKGAAKGLPRKSLQAVKDYLTGEAVRVVRMLGVFESLVRRDEIAPHSEIQWKQVKTVDQKRHPSGRPWTIEETEKLL